MRPMIEALCRDCGRFHLSGPARCTHCDSERIIGHAEIKSLAIAHIDCDAFYASVEKRDRPEIANQPLIVGHPGGRGVVTTACYIARRSGVRSAMPMFQALERCPHAVVIPPDMAKYKTVSTEMRDIFRRATPLIEPVSLDEAYLDLTEMTGEDDIPAVALARIAKRVEREVGITVSIGLSCNKFLAKLASEMRKPRGYSIIGAAEATRVLAPMPVSKINGVGAVMARRLEAQGIRTIGDLQALSEMQLVTQHGKFGRRLARFAQGDDDRTVTPDRATKSISAETTFRTDLSAAADLGAAARALCDRVADQLVRKGLAGATVVLKLKTSDFRLLTRHRRLGHPTQRAHILYEATRQLIDKEADGRTFRLIGVGIDQLYPAADADPPDLFSS